MCEKKIPPLSLGSHYPGARHSAPSVASSGEEFSLHLACCTSFGFWSPHPPACWRKVWRMFSLTSSLPTPSVRLWTVSLTFCYILLGQTLGPRLKSICLLSHHHPWYPVSSDGTKPMTEEAKVSLSQEQ